MWLLVLTKREAFYFLYEDIRREEASQKEEFANSLYLSNTF